jgi:nucleotide-binding universal stress UspA family protein
MKPFQKILVATDFGDSSSLALEHGADLALRYGAELIVAHVVEPGTPLLSGTMMSTGGDGTATVQLGLSAGVERAKATVPAARGVLLEGHAADQILTFVEENAVDLVVVGTHGRGRAARLVLGSVAEKVVRSCRVPVLTVYDTEDRAVARLGASSPG